MQETWAEIETTLRQLHALPHNQVWQRENGRSLDDTVNFVLGQLRSGLVGTPQRERFVGPRLFMRVVGAGNRAYGGEWWFDAALLDQLDSAYERIYFNRADRDGAIRALLREALAIRTEWNPIDEIWSLELPAGETLTGYSGPGTRQPLFGNLPLSDKANRLLVGGVRQVWFPVKNPLWVQLHRQLQ